MDSNSPVPVKFDHIVGVISSLNAQRKNQTDLCDVELNMADGTLYSHKAVLVTCSKYFEAMFSHDNMVENVEGRIELSQFSSDVMEALLTYIYTGEIDLFEDNLVSRLEAAQYFQIDGVVESCCEFMVASLSSTNYADFLNETSRLSLQEIESKINMYIESNLCFNFVEESKGQFQKLSYEYVHKILNTDNNLLKVKSEYEIFQISILWSQGGVTPDSRCEELKKLLHECVRYPLIPLTDLTDHVLSYVSDKNDRSLLNAAMDAQTYHLRSDKHTSEYAGQRKATLRFFSDAIITLPQKGSKYLQMWQHPIEESTAIPTANAPEYILSNAAIAEMEGFIYVAGGQTSEQGMTLVQRYNPRNGTWFECASMQNGRYDFSLSGLTGKLYAVGGRMNSSICTNVVECYDAKKNTWEEVKHVTGSLKCHGATVNGDKLYIAGGERGAIQCYDPVSNKWESLVEDQCLANKHVYRMYSIEDMLYILWADKNLYISEENIYRFPLSTSKIISSLSSANYAKLISAYLEDGKLRIIGQHLRPNWNSLSDGKITLFEVESLEKCNVSSRESKFNTDFLHAQRVRIPKTFL